KYSISLNEKVYAHNGFATAQNNFRDLPLHWRLASMQLAALAWHRFSSTTMAKKEGAISYFLYVSFNTDLCFGYISDTYIHIKNSTINIGIQTSNVRFKYKLSIFI
ncbi:hypothetical protein ACJX0J_012446, partial [Zea mays]